MEAKTILKNQAKDKKNVSSYIFYGSDQELIYRAALDFASDFEISKFDVVEIMPEAGDGKSKNEIKIKAIRELIRQINLAPRRGNKKLAIIKEADRLNIEAANTLLKTLEEPPASSLIILLSRDLKLLPTIISRCQIIRFSDRKEQEDENVVKDLLGREKKNLKAAFSAAEKLSTSDDLENYFEKALGYLKAKLSSSPDPVTLAKIKAIFMAKKNSKVTTNKRLVLENLILAVQDGESGN